MMGRTVIGRFLAGLCFALASCTASAGTGDGTEGASKDKREGGDMAVQKKVGGEEAGGVTMPEGKKQAEEPKAQATRETAILAGGCFWGMEDIIRKIPGVIETEVGYTGGSFENPKYTDVKTGRTGHAESIRVVFDPRKLSYEALLGFYFRMHDPTTPNRQGNDMGTQYRSAIFTTSEEQKRVALAVRERVDKSGKWKRPIVTEIQPAGPFYPAEDYHQDYLEKHPGGYTCHFLRD